MPNSVQVSVCICYGIEIMPVGKFAMKNSNLFWCRMEDSSQELNILLQTIITMG